MFPVKLADASLPLGVAVSTISVPGQYCETMIFGGEYDQECQRTSNSAQALELHEAVVGRLTRGEHPFSPQPQVEAETDSDPRHDFELPVSSRDFLEGVLAGLAVPDGNKALVREGVERELQSL